MQILTSESVLSATCPEYSVGTQVDMYLGHYLSLVVGTNMIEPSRYGILGIHCLALWPQSAFMGINSCRQPCARYYGTKVSG